MSSSWGGSLGDRRIVSTYTNIAASGSSRVQNGHVFNYTQVIYNVNGQQMRSKADRLAHEVCVAQKRKDKALLKAVDSWNEYGYQTIDVYGVRLLLEQGADKNCEDEHQRTPLHLAAASDYGCVELLLLAGADVNRKDCSGDTALHNAAHVASADSVRTLIEAGSDIHALNNDGATPLGFAIRNEKCAYLLIQAGAEVDHKDNNGRTPLHRCCDRETTDLLLDSGANINARDDDGQAPLGRCAKLFTFGDEKSQKIACLKECGGIMS